MKKKGEKKKDKNLLRYVSLKKQNRTLKTI